MNVPIEESKRDKNDTPSYQRIVQILIGSSSCGREYIHVSRCLVDWCPIDLYEVGGTNKKSSLCKTKRGALRIFNKMARNAINKEGKV